MFGALAAAVVDEGTAVFGGRGSERSLVGAPIVDLDYPRSRAGGLTNGCMSKIKIAATKHPAQSNDRLSLGN